MSDTPSRWADLATRIATASVLGVVGIAALWLGGLWFVAFVALVALAMIWELVQMLAPKAGEQALVLGLLAAMTVGGLVFIGWVATGLLVLAVLGFGLIVIDNNRWIWVVYGAALMLACFALILLRLNLGLSSVLWLVLVVIASDTAGYFVGRRIGGPKFWPRVSPKKTWSGTVAGWVAAALVGLGFVIFGHEALSLVLISPLVAFAAQIGDIAESSIKRRVGVKDSSHLLPGHGGVLDRFDALVGAALVVLLTVTILGTALVGG